MNKEELENYYKVGITKSKQWFYNSYNNSIDDLYRLHISKKNTKINSININNTQDIYKNINKSIYFNINTSNITFISNIGKPFRNNIFYDWILDIDKNMVNNYKNTLLYKHLKISDIKNLKQYYNITQPCILDKASKFNIFYPWICNKKHNLNKMQNFELYEVKFCGELSDSIIDLHFIKYKRILESIKKHGVIFAQNINEGLVTGFFLVDGENFKFVITRGIHRIGVIKYLNIKECLVDIDKDCVPIINKKDINEWYFVKNKFITKEIAEDIFNFYMTL